MVWLIYLCVAVIINILMIIIWVIDEIKSKEKNSPLLAPIIVYSTVMFLFLILKIVNVDTTIFGPIVFILFIVILGFTFINFLNNAFRIKLSEKEIEDYTTTINILDIVLIIATLCFAIFGAMI